MTTNGRLLISLDTPHPTPQPRPGSEWQGPRLHPIDPAAHAKLREHFQRQQNQPAYKPQPKPEDTKPMTRSNLMPIDEVRERFGDTVAEALAIQRPKKSGRRLTHVFTQQVKQYLYDQHLANDAPRPCGVASLGEQNDIITMSRSAMYNVMKDFRPATAVPSPTLAVSPEVPNEVTIAVDPAEPGADETTTAVVENPSFKKYTDDRLDSFAVAMRNIPLLPGLSFEPTLDDFSVLQAQLNTVLIRLNQIPGVTATGFVSFNWSNEEATNGAH